MKDRLLGFLRSLRDYSGSFWVANISELFERIAFYGMTPMLVLYLTESRGFDSKTAIAVGGNFGFLAYLLPVFSGFLADYLGYRRAMMMAYALLAGGYFAAGRSTGYAPILLSLVVIAFGASLIKPTITGTVQKSCPEARRAMGFSVYYMIVNIGGFLGPNLSAQVREHVGVQYVFWVSSGAAVVALMLATFIFREPAGAEPEQKRSIVQFAGDFGRVATNPKLMLLFLFVAGWWSMFFQFFNVLPLYLRDDLRVSGWLLGFIPALGAGTIICLQVVVGYLVRDVKPFRAILFAVALSSAGVALIGVYPSVLLAGAGVVIFSLGEMTYSAHFYHYLGNIAPRGQVGMYMGFAFLPIAVGSLISGQIGGPVSAYFRDTLHAPQMMWFAFAGVGLASAMGVALLTKFSRANRQVECAGAGGEV